jgi:SAM-dependent methyltransferase
MHTNDTASPWFVEHASLVAPAARLLDVAAGHGRHARFFANRGARVTAVDRDPAAVASLQAVSGVVAELRDLESDSWPYAVSAFDAVIVCNYLWRPSFASTLATVTSGGALIYETFMAGNERYGKPSRAEFLLQSNELLSLTRDMFRVVAFAEGPELDATGQCVAMKQKIAAIKR